MSETLKMTSDVHDLEELEVMSDPIKPASSDEALMVRVQENDQRAFETLYDRHRVAVFWLAMRILDDRELAADATQEAFMRLWNNRASYQGGRGRVKWWLLRIVRNGAIDVLRRERDVVPLTEEVFDLFLSDSVEEEVIAGAEQRELVMLLEQLPSKQREVIELAYFADLTQAEITQRLDLPLGTIKSRIRLALEKLRDSLPSDRNAGPPPMRPARQVSADHT